MRIKTRLLLLLIPAIFLILTLLTFLSYLNANRQAENLALTEARGIALESSEQIFSNLRQAEDAALMLASSIMEMKRGGEPSRQAMSEIAKGTTLSSEEFFGVWVLWEPNAYDGKDAEFIKDPDYGNEEGRANAYWMREDGDVIYDPSENYDHEFYYSMPKEKRRLTLVPPYRDLDTPDKVLMTTLAMPMLEGGRALGVVGVDIELEFINKLLAAIKPYESGYAMLISDQGAIIGGPGADAKRGADLPLVPQEVRDKMRGGKSFFLEGESLTVAGEEVRCFYTPFKLASFDAPWYFMVALPMDKVMADSRSALLIQLGISLLALLLLVGLVFYTAGGVSRPLRRIAAYAGEVASGNFKSQLDDRGFALELHELQVALRSMIESLLKTMDEVEERNREAGLEAEKARNATQEAEKARVVSESGRQAMQEVAKRVDAVSQKLQDTAGELSATIAGASRETREQNRLVEETVHAISGMAVSITRVSENAGDAAEFTGKTMEKARGGAEVVSSTLQAFTGIRRETEQLSSQIDDLSKRTEDIGVILSMINDIADQTNLLALNAAIEAARAGEAGRGFAVVADEVRKLAEKTVQATKQVEDAVNGIRGSMSVSAQGASRAAQSVENTVSLAQEAQSSLTDIVTLVQAMSEQIHGIAALCREQAVTSEQVGGIADRLSQISLVVDGAMEASADITRTLEPEARELGLLVEQLSKQ